MPTKNQETRMSEAILAGAVLLHAAFAYFILVGACGAQQPQAPSLAIGAVLFEPVPPVVNSNNALIEFARSAAFLDDLDGDGRSEVLVGSPSGGLPNGNVSNAGILTVHSSVGLAPIYQVNGPTMPEQRYGFLVTVVGDVDQDGVHDIASLTSTSSQVGSLPPSIELRSGATGALIYAIIYSGNSTNSITFDRMRDVNGDGIDDMVVGDADAGGIEVRSGSTGGLLASLGGVGGLAASTLGDIDGDGTDDVHCYAMLQSPIGYVLRYAAGQLTILYQFGGSQTSTYGGGICGAGDFDSDGCDDFLVAGSTNIFLASALPIEVRSGASGQMLKTLPNPGSPWNLFGRTMRRVGDIDGDGFGDIAVAAPEENYLPLYYLLTGVGALYIYSGASLELIFEIPGLSSITQYLTSIAGGGDFNGDGFGDIVVGASTSVFGAGYPDYMCVYLGSPVFDADAARGTVNQNGSGVIDVLGAAAPGAAQPEYGGLSRSLVLPRGSAVDFWLARPPGHSTLTANHLIFGKLETAASFTTFGLPLGLGNLAFVPSFVDASNPCLFVLCSTWGVPAAVPSIPAGVGGLGAIVASTPPIPVPLSLLVQGLVEDDSAGAVPLAITNLLHVVVR